ncbi:MAG: diguanylate cyclase, partial [Proteobacteria bacterium]|nr:diguanylate cyclase [Pseudomonadota bacterium]
MRKPVMSIVRVILIISLLSLTGCEQAEKEKILPKAVHGTFDLRDWNFKSDGSVDLSGERAFYWDRLLIEEDFQNRIPSLKTAFVKLPGVWNGQELNGVKLSGQGYGTYRLKV